MVCGGSILRPEKGPWLGQIAFNLTFLGPGTLSSVRAGKGRRGRWRADTPLAEAGAEAGPRGPSSGGGAEAERRLGGRRRPRGRRAAGDDGAAPGDKSDRANRSIFRPNLNV